jgi:Meiotically up-regulated gene 113
VQAEARDYDLPDVAACGPYGVSRLGRWYVMSAVSRETVVAAIQRTAAANGGKPLGRRRFEQETGIQPSDWLGRYWARWGDALVEAGFEPNGLQDRYDDIEVLATLVDEIRRLGHIPTGAELKLRRHQDCQFPSHNVFTRFGTKTQLVIRLQAYCRDHPDHDDVEQILAMSLLTSVEHSPDDPDIHDGVDSFGFVYLLKSGRYFKIGRTNSAGRRERELAIQLPERTAQVHVIETDDPTGIERYWHQRFADRRKNGEWFELSPADVKAFKRRKFM